MSMAERIKELRLAAGLTQEELGDKLGLQKSAIAKYENGRVENIKRSTIQAMADLFGVRPSYILGFDDEEDAPNTVTYYLDKEAAEIAQEVYDRPELKMLFDASRKVGAEDIQFVVEMIDRMAKKERGED